MNIEFFPVTSRYDWNWFADNYLKDVKPSNKLIYLYALEVDQRVEFGITKNMRLIILNLVSQNQEYVFNDFVLSKPIKNSSKLKKIFKQNFSNIEPTIDDFKNYCSFLDAESGSYRLQSKTGSFNFNSSAVNRIMYSIVDKPESNIRLYGNSIYGDYPFKGYVDSNQVSIELGTNKNNSLELVKLFGLKIVDRSRWNWFVDYQDLKLLIKTVKTIEREIRKRSEHSGKRSKD